MVDCVCVCKLFSVFLVIEEKNKIKAANVLNPGAMEPVVWGMGRLAWLARPWVAPSAQKNQLINQSRGFTPLHHPGTL